MGFRFEGLGLKVTDQNPCIFVFKPQKHYLHRARKVGILRV